MNPPKSLISVVIPTHNRRHLVQRAIGSALSQQNVDVEVVVCDDGSTDGTAKAIEAMADPRVRVTAVEGPGGVSAARNHGIAQARGKWVAFLDDDDLWAPGKLAAQLEAVALTGREWACAGTVVVDTDLRILAGDKPPSAELIADSVAYRNIVPGGASGVLVRKAVVAEVGGFDDGLRHLPDWDLWTRLAIRGLPAVVEDPVVAYVLHSGNASLDAHEIAAEFHTLDERYRPQRNGEHADRAYVYRWVGSSSLRAGRRLQAVRSYSQAVLGGDWGSIPRGLASLVYPQSWLPRRRRRSNAWSAQAEQWLEPIRSAT
ncbi:MAG: glycosyltransferase family 2 protein [Acidimicrobiia bacterium]|nr:glycosyltransferase family 2 protein [Acidimicrobiia bacterium]